MIRNITDKDLFEVNNLLQIFNVKYSTLDYNKDYRKILVYEETGTILGVLVYLLIYDRIEIEYIVVNNNYKNIGIGSKLLKYIEHDIKNITLEVRKSNNIAIEFYKKNGYKIEAVRHNYYKTEDGYLMMKNLGDNNE